MKNYVRAVLFYNLWQDRHSGNYFRTARHRVALIDFYSKASNETDRFMHAFTSPTLHDDIGTNLCALVRQVVLEKGECSDDEFTKIISDLTAELDIVLHDERFCIAAHALAAALPWGDFPRKRVADYYSTNLNDLDAAKLMGNALYQMATRLGVGTAQGGFLFRLSRQY